LVMLPANVSGDSAPMALAVEGRSWQGDQIRAAPSVRGRARVRGLAGDHDYCALRATCRKRDAATWSMHTSSRREESIVPTARLMMAQALEWREPSRLSAALTVERLRGAWRLRGSARTRLEVQAIEIGEPPSAARRPSESTPPPPKPPGRRHVAQSPRRLPVLACHRAWYARSCAGELALGGEARGRTFDGTQPSGEPSCELPTTGNQRSQNAIERPGAHRTERAVIGRRRGAWGRSATRRGAATGWRRKAVRASMILDRCALAMAPRAAAGRSAPLTRGAALGAQCCG